MPTTSAALYAAWQHAMRFGTFAQAQAALSAYYVAQRDPTGQTWAQASTAASTR